MKVTQAQADKYGVSLAELEKLAEGKDCPTYPGETLHVRRVRPAKGETQGKLVVFNISEKARGEQISATKQARSRKNTSASSPAEAVAAVAAAPATL